MVTRIHGTICSHKIFLIHTFHFFMHGSHKVFLAHFFLSNELAVFMFITSGHGLRLISCRCAIILSMTLNHFHGFTFTLLLCIATNLIGRSSCFLTNRFFGTILISTLFNFGFWFCTTKIFFFVNLILNLLRFFSGSGAFHRSICTISFFKFR